MISPVKRGDGINITRGEVLAGIHTYNGKDQDDLVWLHGFALDVLKGCRSAFVEWISVDWTTVTRVWSGKYPSSIDSFMDRVRYLRHKEEISIKTDFIETIITRRIFKICDEARNSGLIAMIAGASGRSKTHSVREWRRLNNHGRALYIYAPETGGLTAFLHATAKVMGISTRKPKNELTKSIERGLDYRNVLIIDEVAHLMPIGRGQSVQSLEFIRGLHDRTGCGIILVATKLFEAELAGGKWAAWFEQLQGRIEIPFNIPDKFSRGEIADIVSAYSADPSPDMIRVCMNIANARTGGCRQLFRHLGRATQAAGKLNEPLAAKHISASVKFAADLLSLSDDKDKSHVD